MGIHTDELNGTIERKMAAKKIDRPVAIQVIRMRTERAIRNYGVEIEEIIALTDGELTSHERSKVNTLENWIRIERDRLRDLEELAVR